MIQAPRGTKDVLPSEVYKWQYIENIMRKIASIYCLKEIRTPVFEHTELFERGVGETTDVVQKEMYTFNDRGGRSITLKPEGTASSVRAFVENGLFSDAQPTKLFYFTPAFRYEKAQKGRLREHHQFGVEIFGASDPSIDTEIITIIKKVYSELGVHGVQLNINNIGCPKCRNEYNNALKKFLAERYDSLCDTCKTRFEKNPMRIIDCKEKKCQEAIKGVPLILDYVCDDCRDHFEKLKRNLEALNIDYVVNPFIVRGLDYYTKTVFEFVDNGITLCGGGRYDNLICECGGPSLPAVGFGMGMERLLLTLNEKNINIPEPQPIELYIASMDDKCKLEALKLVNMLRKRGVKCDCDHMGRSFKAQMKYSNKVNARFIIVIGGNEVASRCSKIKRMSDGEQFEVNLDNHNDILDILANNN